MSIQQVKRYIIKGLIGLFGFVVICWWWSEHYHTPVKVHYVNSVEHKHQQLSHNVNPSTHIIEKVYRLPDCKWPPPLYPNSPKTPQSTLDAMKKVQEWFEDNFDQSYVYLFEGGLLGMYRDGAMVPGDQDTDICYAVEPDFDKKRLKELTDMEKLKSKYHLSIQWMWDRWRHASIKNSTKLGMGDPIDFVRNSLCMPSRSCPLPSTINIRARLEFEYGAHWFVKMPWKCQMLELWYFWSCEHCPTAKKRQWGHFRDKWRKSVNIIKQVDGNSDGIISLEEVDRHVIKDGIDVEEYKRQIAPRDKCRAAAMMTWILNYDKKPYHIKEKEDKDGNKDEGVSTIFAFPECDK